MYRVAQEQLFHPRYTALRGVLYSYAAEGGLTGKQLLAVTEVRRADWVEEGVALVGVQECHKDRSGMCALVCFCNCTATNTCTVLEESSSMALTWSLLFLVQVLLLLHLVALSLCIALLYAQETCRMCNVMYF